jgi:hypothetical protein
MRNLKKAETIVSIEKLRFIESELFRLTSKYGVRTIGELDGLIERGKLSEEAIGDDLFVVDYLLCEKEKVEKELYKLNVKKGDVWKSLQHLLELQKLSFRI